MPTQSDSSEHAPIDSDGTHGIEEDPAAWRVSVEGRFSRCAASIWSFLSGGPDPYSIILCAEDLKGQRDQLEKDLSDLRRKEQREFQRAEEANASAEKFKPRIKERQAEIDQFCSADQDKRDADKENSRLQAELERLKEARDNYRPKNWYQFEDWCEFTFKGKLVLTDRAKRTLRNAAAAPEKVEQAVEGLKWLAGEYRTEAMGGRVRWREKNLACGLLDAPCGKKDTLPTEGNCRWPERPVDRHLKSERHKNSNRPRDVQRNSLRIYYFWDKETKLVVVDRMPDHW